MDFILKIFNAVSYTELNCWKVMEILQIFLMFWSRKKKYWHRNYKTCLCVCVWVDKHYWFWIGRSATLYVFDIFMHFTRFYFNKICNWKACKNVMAFVLHEFVTIKHFKWFFEPKIIFFFDYVLCFHYFSSIFRVLLLLLRKKCKTR